MLEKTRPRILVVEDQGLARNSYCEFLCENNLCAHGAASISEAVQTLSEKKFAVIVLDLNLHGESGFDLIDTIRLMQRIHPFTQYVLISAEITIETVMRALHYSVCDILHKPFNPPELLASVMNAIAKETTLRERAEQEAAALEELNKAQVYAEKAIHVLLKSSDRESLNIRLKSRVGTQKADASIKRVKLAISRLESILAIFGNETITSKWHILLIIYDAHLSDVAITAKTIAVTTKLPFSTILRKLSELEDDGLIERREDPNDARRSFISLSDEGLKRFRHYFSIVDDLLENKKCMA